MLETSELKVIVQWPKQGSLELLGFRHTTFRAQSLNHWASTTSCESKDHIKTCLRHTGARRWWFFFLINPNQKWSWALCQHYFVFVTNFVTIRFSEMSWYISIIKNVSKIIIICADFLYNYFHLHFFHSKLNYVFLNIKK